MDEEIPHDQMIARIQWFYIRLWEIVKQNDSNEELQKILLELREDYIQAFNHAIYEY